MNKTKYDIFFVLSKKKRYKTYNIKVCKTIHTEHKSITVRQAPHSAHNSEHIVVSGIDSHLRGVGTRDRCVRKHELEGRVINAREVAGARWLVLLRLESERVDVNTRVRRPGMVLPRLDLVKVGSFTLRETILAIELELGSDHWVLAPAVHVEGSLGKDKGARIRHSRLELVGTAGAAPHKVRAKTESVLCGTIRVRGWNTHSTTALKEATRVDHSIG